MAKYSEEDIMRIVRGVIAAMENGENEGDRDETVGGDRDEINERDSVRYEEDAEKVNTAGYAETIEDDLTTSKEYKKFSGNLCLAIGDEMFKNLLSIREAKNIIRVLEDFVHNCEPDFYIEKIGECHSEDLARYTISWFKIVYSAIRLRNALKVEVVINEAPTADFLGKYDERGYINEISGKLEEFQDMFNHNLDKFRNGNLNCTEEEMMTYHKIVMDEMTSFSKWMVCQYKEEERAYFTGDTKRCINLNELWECVDPFVFTEERNCNTIKFFDGDNETVLYTLGE